MLVNGYTVGQWQRCKRPWAISRTHNLFKWRPQSLLAACLRHGIFMLSNGEMLEKASVMAANNFLSSAKSPGLDLVGVDTYTLSLDYCAIIRNVLECLSRSPLVSLREVPAIRLSDNVSWQFLSHMDETGTLHRWKFVDYIEEDIIPELHAWEVFGDIAAADAPMTLHLLAIGQRKGCHQNSPWCRIYSHPNLPNILHFKKKKGGELKGEWRPVWFSGNSANSPKSWVDLMIRDNAVTGLVRHTNVSQVSEEHLKLFKRDVLMEAEGMATSRRDKVDPREYSMSRYACDHPYECPHQLFCYNTSLSLEKTGIYQRRDREDSDGADTF